MNDLYVLLHLTATVIASGSLTYLMGCGVASYYSQSGLLPLASYGAYRGHR
jgi:hypothetical protein